MATYNGENYLRTQLDSLYAQSRIPDEIIVVDDNSKDGTIAILDEYATKKGLIYHVNKKNLGVNANFEKALLLCTGDYIMFCDQDDYWFPNKIELMLTKMLDIEKKNYPCMVTSRDTYADKNLVPNEKLNIYNNTTIINNDNIDYKKTILLHLSQGCSLMLNRQCIQYILPFPKNEQGICYDLYAGYIIAMIGCKYDMKESLMLYRVHDNNVTAKLKQNNQNKTSKIRIRSTSIVPLHYIETFKLANTQISSLMTKEKLSFVNNIIKLADINLSFYNRIKILFQMPEIRYRDKARSIKYHIFNIICSRIKVRK